MSRRGIDPVGVAGAAGVTLFAAILSSVVFGRIPHVQDSIAQLFQARIFAHGRLWMPSPPLREFFDYAHIINDGRWYSQYPPGHSLFLVPGVWLGAPWLVNPLLGGLAVYGIFVLAREAFGTAAARAAVLLAILSPFLVVMSSEFMAHASGLFTVTWFLVHALRALRTGERRPAVIGAVFLLLAVLIRPYTALACALPVFAAGGWKWLVARKAAAGSAAAGPAAAGFAASGPGPRPVLVVTLVLAAGFTAGVVLYGLYNWGTTGDPMTPGYVKLYGPSHGLGFGKGSWGPPHTPARGLKHAWANLRGLNRDLFEWPLTSLWPFLVALLPGGAARAAARRKEDPAARASGKDSGRAGGADGARGGGARVAAMPGTTAILATVPLSLLVLHIFYWYQDLCFGPRYLYESLGPVLALSGVGIVRACGWLAGAARMAPAGSRGMRRWIPLVVLLVGLFAYAGAVGWPRLFRTPAAAASAAPATGVRMGSYFQHYGPQFWGVGPRLGEIVESQVSRRAIVFVRLREPEPNNPQVRHMWFGSAFARLDPDLERARIIYAKDRGAENGKLLAAFPGRAAYLYSGTIEGGTVAPWTPAP